MGQESCERPERVTVAVRARPHLQREMLDATTPPPHRAVRLSDANTIQLKQRPDARPADTKVFTFDHAFDAYGNGAEPPATQTDLYNTLGRPLLNSALEGYNVTLFAYGQTSSGKTYSVSGTRAEPGIVTRFVRELFARCEAQRATAACTVEVSYVEIYLEQIRDLLDPSRRKGSLRIREHPQLGPYVEDLSKTICSRAEEVESLLAQGSAIRTACATSMNASSSRSHALCNITLTQQTQVTDADGSRRASEKVSKVSLVDLAGSERSKRTGSSGQRLQEAGSINKSLGALGAVISALASGKPGQHVPYRDSSLTWLLKDCLGGNARTCMLATISPSFDDYAETLSTLRYAETAKKIVNEARVNMDAKSNLIGSLQGEIERLRAALNNTGASAEEAAAARDELEQSLKLKAEAEMTLEEKLRSAEARSIHREVALSAMEEQVRELQQRLMESERARQEQLQQLHAIRSASGSAIEARERLAATSDDATGRSGIVATGVHDGSDDELPLEFATGLLSRARMGDGGDSSGTDELPEEFYCGDGDGAATASPPTPAESPTAVLVADDAYDVADGASRTSATHLARGARSDSASPAVDDEAEVSWHDSTSAAVGAAEEMNDADSVDPEFLEEVLRRLASGRAHERERMQIKLQQAQQMHRFEMMSYASGESDSMEKAHQWARAANALQAAFSMSPSSARNARQPQVWCSMEGWLLKKEGRSTTGPPSWHRYWYMLVEGCLLQYSQRSDLLPNGVISLFGFEPSTLGRGVRMGQKAFCFKLRTAFGTHNLACESSDDRNEWLEALSSIKVSPGSGWLAAFT